MDSDTGQLVREHETELVKTTNGHVLRAFRDDYITYKIKKRGIYEPLPLALVSGILRKIPGSVVLDIGGNIGNHALSFSMDAATVFSFEPVGTIFNLLQENISSNQAANVTCFNFGFSDRNASAEIFVNEDGNMGGSSLEHRGERSVSEVVELVEGDTWIASQGDRISRIDFIKMDVEGHEPKALAGLQKTLLKFRPILMMEYNGNSNASAFKASGVFDTLFSEYRIYVLGNNFDSDYYESRFLGRARRFLVRAFSRKKVKLYGFDPLRQYHNILLVPKEKVGLLPKSALK